MNGTKTWALLAATMLLSPLMAGSGVVFGAPAGSAGQSAMAGPKVSASAGFGDDGAYVIGEWFPVRVTLDNPAGATALRVRVEVDSKGDDESTNLGTYTREVDLPGPSRKEVTLYAYTTGYKRSIDVRVMQGSTTLATARAGLSPHEEPADVVIGVASSDASLLNALSGEEVAHAEAPAQADRYGYGSPPTPGSSPARAAVEHITLDDLPTLSPALNALGVLVIDDADTSRVSAEQNGALSAWIERGGMLIVIGRPGGAPLDELSDLLPVSVGAPREVASLDSLAALVSVPFTATGSISVLGATVKADNGVQPRVLASQEGTPLVVVREVGHGHVVYMGLSPGVAPLKGWDGTVPLLKRILAEHPVRASLGATRRTAIDSSSLFDTYNGVFDLPSLNLPEPLLVGAFLLVYLLVVGPLNFFILRRMRRAELAWVTVPALVLIFSVGAYVLAFQSKGGDVIAIQGDVVHTVPGVAEAQAVQFVGIFSPVRDTYNLTLDYGGAVTEVNERAFRETPSDPVEVTGQESPQQTSIKGVNIGTWSFRGFMAEHTVKAQSPLEARLRLGENAIVGTVRNSTSGSLEDVALVRGNAVQHIGHMAAGQEVAVSLPFTLEPLDGSALSRILPPPPGVTMPNLNGYPYSTSQRGGDAQRAYTRRAELLNMGLGSLVTDAPPIRMEVTGVAWEPSTPASPGLSMGFSIDGHTARVEGASLWTSELPLSGDEGGTARAKSLAYAIYAPGNSIPWTAGPNVSSSGGGYIPPSPPSYGSVVLKPYADVFFRVPPGTRVDSLTFSYKGSTFTGSTDIFAFNTQTGKWDKIGSAKGGGSSDSTISVPVGNPAQYVGSAGEITIRLRSDSEMALSDAPVGMSLNEGR